ncbi:unnamed protein product [Urochloa humidicola]
MQTLNYFQKFKRGWVNLCVYMFSSFPTIRCQLPSASLRLFAAGTAKASWTANVGDFSRKIACSGSLYHVLDCPGTRHPPPNFGEAASSVKSGRPCLPLPAFLSPWESSTPHSPKSSTRPRRQEATTARRGENRPAPARSSLGLSFGARFGAEASKRQRRRGAAVARRRENRPLPARSSLGLSLAARFGTEASKRLRLARSSIASICSVSSLDRDDADPCPTASRAPLGDAEQAPPRGEAEARRAQEHEQRPAIEGPDQASKRWRCPRPDVARAWRRRGTGSSSGAELARRPPPLLPFPVSLLSGNGGRIWRLFSDEDEVAPPNRSPGIYSSTADPSSEKICSRPAGRIWASATPSRCPSPARRPASDEDAGGDADGTCEDGAGALGRMTICLGKDSIGWRCFYRLLLHDSLIYRAI